MKFALSALSVMMLASSAFAAPAYEVCNTQINDYINRLGDKVVGIHYIGAGRQASAIVTTEGCTGSYQFNFNTNDFTCIHTAHYGKVPNYINNVIAFGDCRAE